MIKKVNDVYFINTRSTSYILRIKETGHVEHLHYGRRIEPTKHVTAMFGKSTCAEGNSISYNRENLTLSLENENLEMSSYGKGDIRESFVNITHSDGGRSSDFLFRNAEILDRKSEIPGLPSAYSGASMTASKTKAAGLEATEMDKKSENRDKVSELVLTLYDEHYDIELKLIYDAFYEADVITRRTVIRNCSDKNIIVDKMMSMQLDFSDNDYDFITFGGAWAREMNMARHSLSHGKLVNSSFTGTSSNRSNPFTMLVRKDTTETAGDCYGFNLIYSGNHYTVAETSYMGKLRIVSGINPEGFSFVIEPEKEIYSPEAVMTFSAEGMTEMSHNLHYFINNHIVRGKWKKRVRPVLLNSWEAAYFDIDEGKLTRMARCAKDVGIELFVMDDGWFGRRNDDKTSLGDWDYNPEKLPGGVKRLSSKIHDMGLLFGIWVEPEMVSEESELYRAHPDWAMKLPDKPHSEGRNQMILDLTQDDVCDYLIEAMTKVFSEGNVDYVKWDMNRIFSDVYSSNLPSDRQGEVFHRYVLGLYRIMGELNKRFPEILFEGCASGGNRFDLGILCYMPQIWASDNTDAYERAVIQTGLSFGYPLSAMSCHVSASPNHQTLRKTSLETRFDVAAFGVMGYELNLEELSREEKDAVKEQIEFYKKNRKLFQYGLFYRIKSGEKDNYTNGQYKWNVVSYDRRNAAMMFLQGLSKSDYMYADFKPRGLAKKAIYHFTNRRIKYNIKEFGDLVNTVAPIHIKKDSLLHNAAAKIIKMDSEKEDYLVTGEMAMYAGIKLKEAYTGTGYSDEVRLFRDCEARLYTLCAVEEDGE